MAALLTVASSYQMPFHESFPIMFGGIIGVFVAFLSALSFFGIVVFAAAGLLRGAQGK